MFIKLAYATASVTDRYEGFTDDNEDNIVTHFTRPITFLNPLAYCTSQRLLLNSYYAILGLWTTLWCFGGQHEMLKSVVQWRKLGKMEFLIFMRFSSTHIGEGEFLNTTTYC
ncbi:hypothetical protein TNIN_399901 [Trichonephila inaurata madagascariensis]|uniref:Uncharacterized protein n=1 Tax=Trichonephila inaurata madagascariensis TaxID=2747483 RepID=A0A8X6WSA5_9ARAC|nr:hypothetical protein TNIN_399901 [Trichonephila inaurata madagascariensis]